MIKGIMGKKHNSGTTLIETLAAFTVLTAIMAILFHIVNFSGEMRTKAVDTAHLDQMMWREIYKTDSAIDTGFVEMKEYAHEGGDTVCNFFLVLDTEKTDLANNYMVGISVAEDTLINNPPKFRLNNMSATSYTCIDELIEEEQLPAPSAMRFRYIPPQE